MFLWVLLHPDAGYRTIWPRWVSPREGPSATRPAGEGDMVVDPLAVVPMSVVDGVVA
jgi:hypothetical protein